MPFNARSSLPSFWSSIDDDRCRSFDIMIIKNTKKNTLMNKKSLGKNAEHVSVSTCDIFYQYSTLQTFVLLFSITKSFGI